MKAKVSLDEGSTERQDWRCGPSLATRSAV